MLQDLLQRQAVPRQLPGASVTLHATLTKLMPSPEVTEFAQSLTGLGLEIVFSCPCNAALSLWFVGMEGVSNS